MSNLQLIKKLFEQQEERGWKPASVYYKLKEKHDQKEIELTKEDLVELAKRLGYREKWIEIKLQELGQPIDSKAAKKTIFDGLVFLKEVKPHTTKKGDLMAFLRLTTASGYEIEGAVFPEVYTSYQTLLNNEEFFWFTGEMKLDSEKCFFVLEKATRFHKESSQKIFSILSTPLE